MSTDEIKFKEQKLRECFKSKLEHLNVEGTNDYETVRCIKTYGALWHYTHQLLKAEYEDKGSSGNSTTTADTMNIQATGLQMRK